MISKMDLFTSVQKIVRISYTLLYRLGIVILMKKNFSPFFITQNRAIH